MEAEKLYFSIGECAEKVGVPDSTLRYWEKRFSFLTPERRGKKRVYSATLVEQYGSLKKYIDAGIPLEKSAKLVQQKKSNTEDILFEIRAFLIGLRDALK